jgi:hypothetical protein
MPFKYTSGSLRGFAIDGIPFKVKADGNLNEKIAEYEIESQPTSGEGSIKMMKVNRNAEGLVLDTSGEDRELLRSTVEDTEVHQVSYIDAAGNTWRCPKAKLNIEGNETETNSTTCSIQVVVPWTVSLV